MESQILDFIQKCVLSCWKQPALQAVGRGPGYGGEMKALVLLHFTVKVLLLQRGACAEAEWDPLKPPLEASSPTGLAQGGGSVGEARQNPGSQPGRAQSEPPCLLLSCLSSSQRLGNHCCLWALCRRCYTNAKEALHPRSLKLLKIHICSPFAAPRN